MGVFKRLCLFLFGLSGILALAALALTWVGPWTTQARSMLEVQWYFITLEVLVCVAALGLLGCLLVSLFAPRNPKETVVAEVEGGVITVTRQAIVAQVRQVIERTGACKASSIHVKVRKRGHVRVRVRVTPIGVTDVIALGDRLYKELAEGLSLVCGDSVESIRVLFTSPANKGVEVEDQASDDALEEIEERPGFSRPQGTSKVSAQQAAGHDIVVHPSVVSTSVGQGAEEDVPMLSPTDAWELDEGQVEDGEQEESFYQDETVVLADSGDTVDDGLNGEV